MALRPGSIAARERQRVTAPIYLCAGLAWLFLALGSMDIAIPAFCTGNSHWSLPSGDMLAFVVDYNSPGKMTLGWAIMVAAMMIPTLGDVVFHVWKRSLARVRMRCVLTLVLGFALVWMLAGLVLVSVALALQLASTRWEIPLLQILALALIWQFSPIKQIALNRCHSRPMFAAFGIAAYRDCLLIGLQAGFWCLASCWPLMLLGLVVPDHHFAAMLLVGALVWAERAERPRKVRWAVRMPTRLCGFLAERLFRRRISPLSDMPPGSRRPLQSASSLRARG